jgi:hypothetical protein
MELIDTRFVFQREDESLPGWHLERAHTFDG